MLKLALSNMALAMLMFICGTSGADAFGIWGVMFMMVASVIVVVGTVRNGS